MGSFVTLKRIRNVNIRIFFYQIEMTFLTFEVILHFIKKRVFIMLAFIQSFDKIRIFKYKMVIYDLFGRSSLLKNGCLHNVKPNISSCASVNIKLLLPI